MAEAEREANRLLGQIQPHADNGYFFTEGNPADELLPNQLPETHPGWISANSAFNRVYNSYFQALEEEHREITSHDVARIVESFRQNQRDHGLSDDFHTRHVCGEIEAYVIGAEEAEEYGPYMEQLRRLRELLGQAIPLDPLPDPGSSPPPQRSPSASF